MRKDMLMKLTVVFYVRINTDILNIIKLYFGHLKLENSTI